jgi:hypothetical protein
MEALSGGAALARPTPTVDLMDASASFDALYVRSSRPWLVVILTAYLVLAAIYAVMTPDWQAPDEPAHYNYIKYVAEHSALPLLGMGDYNGALFAHILSHGFPEGSTINAFRYEYYQPPLYYIAAAPVFLLGQGDPLILRGLNILFGCGVLILLYLALETVFPSKPLITLSAVAFVAMLPMHVALTASMNNDVLAELLLMAAALMLFRWMRPLYGDEPFEANRSSRNQLLLLGLLLGLGLLTKIYAYLVVPLMMATVIYTIWRRDRSWRGVKVGAAQSLWVALPGVILCIPIWARNMTLYGLGDPLALNWHDRVVAGQMRTEEFIRQFGSMAYFERAFDLTFKSFWGVFGWLGVMMDERIYIVALFFSGVIFLGLLWATVRLISGKPDTDMDALQTTILCLLGIWLVFVALGYVWYNLKFVQHQGRYFFWGMLAISTLVAVAWRELLHPLQGVITGGMAAVLALALFASGSISGSMSEWMILIVSAMAMFLLLQPFLLIASPVPQAWTAPAGLVSWFRRPGPARLLTLLRFLAWATPFVLLFLLNLATPFLFIAPQLTK